MPQLFLSHTSIDKPFVEKLYKDLTRLGIQVWYDRYEIKVGNSLLWKIEEGIAHSDYLGVVLSKEALTSEWVRAELAAAWSKQIELHGNFILPIMCRECEIPFLLRDVKYADFRKDYNLGLKDLAHVFNISEVDVITEENWRRFAKDSRSDWRSFREIEFANFITELCRLNEPYQFNLWTGSSKNPFSVSIYKYINQDTKFGLSIRISPKDDYHYMASAVYEGNPTRIAKPPICYLLG